MKKSLKRMLILISALVMTAAPALAEVVSFTGQVTASYTHDVYSPYTGTVGQIHVQPGDLVTEETAIASLLTTRIYAETDGTVTAVFAQPGDLMDTVTTRYGAPIYLDNGVHYTVSASGANGKAYDAVETMRVSPGETVYLQSRSDSDHTGVGTITTVEGTSFQVEVTEGSFQEGESVSLYRTAEYDSEQRIGRGSIENASPTAVAATGRLLSIYVKPGDTVQKGDLLMETLDGGTPHTTVSNMICAGKNGVVASISTQQGASVAENTLVVSIWPENAMRIEITIPESDLLYVSEGDNVEITFDWQDGTTEPIPGVISVIAAASDADTDDTAYTAYVDFTPDETVRYGMNVTVSTVE